MILEIMGHVLSSPLRFIVHFSRGIRGNIRNLHSCTFRSGVRKKLFLLVLVQVWNMLCFVRLPLRRLVRDNN